MWRKSLRSASVSVIIWALVLPMGLSAQEPVDRYEVGRALPPVEDTGSLVHLSLDDAIARALEMNLDIQSVRLNPRIQEYSIYSAEAAFRPSLSTSFSYNNSSNQSTSQLDGGSRITTQRQSLNTSLSQTLPWYGGRLSANFNNGRTESDNAFSTRNPSFSSSVSFSYTQPLLAGRRTDNQRTSLLTSQIQAEITDIQVLSQIENITNNVRTAYWSLRAAIEQIEIQRRSLAQAQELLEQNRIRVQLGTMSELQVVQAESQVAGAEQSLLNAEIQWRNQELSFKRLLVDGAGDPLLRQTVNPTDLPFASEQVVDIDAAISVALAGRTDIVQQRQQRDISELNLAVTEDNARPSLSMTTSYSLSGVGGNLFERSGLGGEAVLVDEGGYLDALQAISDLKTPTFSLSFSFSQPLFMNSAKANMERARLQLRQTELSLRAQELSIVTQVTNAGLNVRDTYLQLQAARRSREVAERSAEIELTRFNVGAATNYEVVQVQDALTSARLSELRATMNHVNAIAEFERVQRVGG
ncbi:TolC family protein [Gemmatimonadota bacterium]